MFYDYDLSKEVSAENLNRGSGHKPGGKGEEMIIDIEKFKFTRVGMLLFFPGNVAVLFLNIIMATMLFITTNISFDVYKKKVSVNIFLINQWLLLTWTISFRGLKNDGKRVNWW